MFASENIGLVFPTSIKIRVKRESTPIFFSLVNTLRLPGNSAYSVPKGVSQARETQRFFFQSMQLLIEFSGLQNNDRECFVCMNSLTAAL